METVIAVSGIPRSGTSMLMAMLEAGGVPLLVDGARPPDPDNPRGYFEYAPVKRLHAGNAWVRGAAAGRALKVVSPLLRHLPREAGLAYRILFAERSLEEVAASQRAMLERQGRHDGVSDARIRALLEGHLEEARALIASRPDMEACWLAYTEMLRAPALAAGRIRDFLGLALDVEAMARAVEPTLRRQRFGG